MHQLFFPPRLEVVVQQQQSDCLPANGGNELSFDRFFSDQPHRPPRKPVGWIGTDHRYDLLALRGIQGRLRAGAGRVDQRTLQPAMMISPSYVADRLRRDSNGPRHHRRRLPFMQQQQRACALNQPYRLNTAAQQRAQCMEIVGREEDDQLAICTHDPA